jgi:CDP-glycerol glycerophosphotransferase
MRTPVRRAEPEPAAPNSPEGTMRVVYRSFDGRYSDNPRALHEALLARGDAADHVWLCAAAHANEFPPDASTVPEEGPEAVEALESADLVVSNTHLSMDWTKRPGATYLQTWHGTPLKTVHRDVTFDPEVPAVVDRDIARWDMLLSQNPDSTKLLPQIFGYHGPVHETGYPRNDLLNAPDAARSRERIRGELGIPAGKTAVLYAPTWRDDQLADDDSPDHRLRLDLERFAAELGTDHVLMVRLHYQVTDALDGIDLPHVMDVSDYPDIRDLILAADVLVNDYASVQFDFAVTGKPILYYVYDLEHYREDLRHFYFDFEEIAPGPLLRTVDEVLSALRDLDGVPESHRERYDRFRERFCCREDGNATERVLAHVLPETVPTTGTQRIRATEGHTVSESGIEETGTGEAAKRIGQAPTTTDVTDPERSSRNTAAGSGSQPGDGSVQPAADEGVDRSKSIEPHNEGAV